jgi:hypothetical protein
VETVLNAPISRPKVFLPLGPFCEHSSGSSAPMFKMPCKWFGITTQASVVTYGWCSATQRHAPSAIRPISFSRIEASSTSPNRHTRSLVQTVTK